MMDRRIAFLQADGSVWLYSISDTAGAPRLNGESDDAYIDRMIERRRHDCEVRGIPFGTRVAVLNESDIARDLLTVFKGGRGWDGTKIVADMPRCREIWKNKLRALRAPLLAALDTDYLRADELGDTALKAQIAAKKQALRAVTDDPRIAAAQTLDQLKMAIPDPLK